MDIIKDILNNIITDVEVISDTDNYNNILSLEKAKDLGLHGGPGNGSGDRAKLCKMYHTTYIYGNNVVSKTYPIDLDLYKYQDKIIEYKKNRRESNGNERGIIGFIIHCKNNDKLRGHPIREDIKKYFKDNNCIMCDASKTICDHKNDLYNDLNVLNTKTQKTTDFQPLCNKCNLRKRAVSIKTVKDKKRQPPPPSIRLLGIDFTQGDENYDPGDINAMVGTYWYDPMAFMTEVLQILRRVGASYQIPYYSNQS